jgi:uncharacterized membrane protein
MQKNRLEAFSDGVLAIVITIMVLELKVQCRTRRADATGAGFLELFVELCLCRDLLEQPPSPVSSHQKR